MVRSGTLGVNEGGRARKDVDNDDALGISCSRFRLLALSRPTPKLKGVFTMDAQHCLAIAAAFIAIIGACASLISGANSKAESLTNRIHEAAKEFREAKLLGNQH